MCHEGENGVLAQHLGRRQQRAARTQVARILAHAGDVPACSPASTRASPCSTSSSRMSSPTCSSSFESLDGALDQELFQVKESVRRVCKSAKGLVNVDTQRRALALLADANLLDGVHGDDGLKKLSPHALGFVFLYSVSTPAAAEALRASPVWQKVSTMSDDALERSAQSLQRLVVAADDVQEEDEMLF